MHLNEVPMISASAIEARIVELAETISRDYAGQEIIAVIVLKGACIFAADLLRQLTAPVSLEFVRARSYRGTTSSGRVDISVLPERSLENAHVLVLEDILDTGRTTSKVLETLAEQHPASIHLCALLDKPSRREVPIEARYTGFRIDDAFVVGYGLDYEEAYRHLPGIHVLEPG